MKLLKAIGLATLLFICMVVAGVTFISLMQILFHFVHPFVVATIMCIATLTVVVYE